jgi:serine/threonine protein phosphatase PrpC
MLRLIYANWQINTAPFEINDCLTTCLFVIRMHGMCHIGQLGDGMIVVCGETKAESLLIKDEKEDSFSNVTQSLGLTHTPEEWRTHVIPEHRCKAVVLCSDGISDDLRPEKQIDFAESVWQEYSSVSYQNRTWSVNSWLKNWPVPFHSDDKTIACLYRK